jgi:hypothetical protein
MLLLRMHRLVVYLLILKRRGTKMVNIVGIEINKDFCNRAEDVAGLAVKIHIIA